MKLRRLVSAFLSAAVAAGYIFSAVSGLSLTAYADSTELSFPMGTTAADAPEAEDDPLSRLSYNECLDIANKAGRRMNNSSAEDGEITLCPLTDEEAYAIERVIIGQSPITKRTDIGELEALCYDRPSDYYACQLPYELRMLYTELYVYLLDFELNGKDIDNEAGFFGFAVPPCRMTVRELESFLCLFFYGNPRFYFLKHKYCYAVRRINGTDLVTMFTLSCYSGANGEPDFTTSSSRREASGAVKNAVNSVVFAMKDMSPAEKENYIARCVCDNVSRKKSGAGQSVYGALIEGKAESAGYANAYSLLCNAAGVECAAVHSSGHIWNMTSLYGNWYCTDTALMDGADKNGSYNEAWHNKSYASFTAGKRSHGICGCYDALTVSVPYCYNDTVLTEEEQTAGDFDPRGMKTHALDIMVHLVS